MREALMYHPHRSVLWRQKNKLCKGLVPESVANYITQHRIYIQRGADA